MKKYIPIALGIAALILIYSVFVRACDIYDSRSVLSGQYQALASAAKKETAKADREIKFYIKHLQIKDQELVDLETELAKKKVKISALSVEQTKLTTALAGATTDAERVPILTTLVESWTVKYTALEEVVADKDKQLSAWTVKFGDMEKISNNYKGLWEDAEGRVVVLEGLRKSLETDLRIARVGGRLKNTVMLAAAGYFAYTLIKK